MQVIVGLIARDGGSVARPGRLGYCPQQALLWEKLTVAEHFELFARAYRLDDQVASDARDGLLAELRFTRYLGYRVEELSGGTRQKLNLALALVHEPQLLLDEPYSRFSLPSLPDGRRPRPRGAAAAAELPAVSPGARPTPRCTATSSTSACGRR